MHKRRNAGANSQLSSYANTKLAIGNSSNNSSREWTNERTNRFVLCVEKELPFDQGKNSRHLIFGCIKMKWRCNICCFLSACVPSNGHGQAATALRSVNMMMSRSNLYFGFTVSVSLLLSDAEHALQTVKMVETNRMHWTHHRKCHCFEAQVIYSYSDNAVIRSIWLWLCAWFFSLSRCSLFALLFCCQ